MPISLFRFKDLKEKILNQDKESIPTNHGSTSLVKKVGKNILNTKMLFGNQKLQKKKITASKI